MNLNENYFLDGLCTIDNLIRAEGMGRVVKFNSKLALNDPIILFPNKLKEAIKLTLKV